MTTNAPEVLVASFVGRTVRETVPEIIDRLLAHPEDRNVLEPLLQQATAYVLDGHGDRKWEKA